MCWEVPEVVINIVDYDMVQQTSLASCEFAKGVNEFIKAGFTAEPATLLQPPMVKESKIKMDYLVEEIKSLGENAGAGNLVICEVLRMHIDDSMLDKQHKMVQHKIHHVARLGGDYCRVNESNLFMVAKPNTKQGIGIDALDKNIRNSRYLTGNHLGMLGNVYEIPAIDPAYEDERLNNIFQYYSISPDEMEKELHLYAKELLDKGDVKAAWQVLLALT